MVALSFVSCGGGSKKDTVESKEDEGIVLSPETTRIKGDLGDYFEVVDKEYIVTNDFGDLVSIEVKRTNTDYAFDLNGIEPYGTSGQGVYGNAGFGIEILDEKGNVIDKVSPTASGLSGMYSSEDMKEALKLKPGETASVRWSRHFSKDKKPVKFRITSAYEAVESSESNSPSTSSYDSDFEEAYNKAKREYNNAYKQAKQDYENAYNEAKQEYEKAYNEVSRHMGF